MTKMLACDKCGVAFPDWDVEIAKEFNMNCPYCDGEIKSHRVVEL